MELAVISNGSEWSALYVDGKLDRVGDHYLIDERIQELTQVVRYEGDFLMGGNHREDCAQSLAEWRDWSHTQSVAAADAELAALAAEQEALAKRSQEIMEKRDFLTTRKANREIIMEQLRSNNGA